MEFRRGELRESALVAEDNTLWHWQMQTLTVGSERLTRASKTLRDNGQELRRGKTQMKIPDEQMESSRRLEEYRLRTEPREIVRVDREDEPFQDDRSMGSLASGLIFGKAKPR